MDILNKITELTKEIETIQSRVEADSANLKELRKALKSFEKIESAAKAIKVPVTEKK